VTVEITVLLAVLALIPARAVTPRASELAFPRDHGAHIDAPVEWWYWTGHLSDRAGHAYGFQVTFFRVRELQLAHFAFTDIARKEFRYEEKMHLALPGVASAAAGRLDVSNEDWSAREGPGGVHLVAASGRVGDLRLTLTPVKAPVLQGENGLSRKGADSREFSHYVSITRLAAMGTLSRGARSEPLAGTAWFDHEWGPGALPAEAAGWDWFALQLDDGSELMLYRIRRADGSPTPFSSGTFVAPRGAPTTIRWSDVRLTETRSWRSPRSRARYPAGWRITVAPIGLDVGVEPLLADQELETPGSTGVTYWEGACVVKGSRAGSPIGGRAYVELTGYAGKDVPGIAEDFEKSNPHRAGARRSLAGACPILYCAGGGSVGFGLGWYFHLPVGLVSTVRKKYLASFRLR
jgi:predicted secreted hydrolase